MENTQKEYALNEFKVQLELVKTELEKVEKEMLRLSEKRVLWGREKILHLQLSGKSLHLRNLKYSLTGYINEQESARTENTTEENSSPGTSEGNKEES